MAIAFESNLATIRHFGSDQNTRVTGSFTPTTGRVLVVPVDSQNQAGSLNDGTGTMGLPTFSGGGTWSWTVLGNSTNATYDPNGGNYYGRVHLAYAVVPSGVSSGTLTLTFNGGGGSVNRNRNIVLADVLEFSGVDTSAPVTQFINSRAGAATSHTATYSSGLAASSAAVAFVGVSYDADHTDVAPPTNHTEVSDYDTSNVDFNHSFVDSYDIGSAGTSLNFTTFPSSTYGSAIIGVELKAAADAASKVFLIT